jgi:hypothetical protein
VKAYRCPLSHSHTRYDSFGRVISSSQRPLHDNIHNTTNRDIHSPAGFEPTMSATEQQQQIRTANAIGTYPLNS